ncbi:MAG: T9SS type A sorting domain-containing protein [Bacteroidetes bacterium]|nr:MAG: T9SS type A sorting domain-containing protein [Bacteroidota bacterium]
MQGYSAITDTYGDNFAVVRTTTSTTGSISSLTKYQLSGLAAGWYTVKAVESGPYMSNARITDSQYIYGQDGQMFISGNKSIGIRFDYNLPSWNCINSTITIEIRNYLGTLVVSKNINVVVTLKRDCAWFNEEINSNYAVPKPLVNFGVLYDGSDRTYYAAQDGSSVALHYASSSSFGKCVSSSGSYFTLSSTGTNFQINGSTIYMIGNNNKIYKADIDAVNGTYTYSFANGNELEVRAGSDIQVSPVGNIFYIGTDNKVRVITGSAGWQHAPVLQQAIDARSGSDLVFGDGKLFYVGTDNYIHYLTYNHTINEWLSYIANTYAIAPKANTEMAYGDGYLFYIGTDNKMHYIDGPNSTDQGVMNSSAPNAYVSGRMGMEYFNGRVQYFTSDRKSFGLDWNGSSWSYATPDYCVQGRVGTDLSLGSGLMVFVNDHDRALDAFKWNNTGCKTDGNAQRPIGHTYKDHDLNLASVELYPNPTTNGLVNLTSATSGSYTISSVDGRVVMEGTVSVAGTHEVQVQDLQKGVYILNWQGDNGVADVQRIVVQ